METLAFNRNGTAYQSLRNIVAEQTDRLVFWVGAGLSRDANAPSWDGLRDSLHRAGEERANDLNPAEGDRIRRELAAIADLDDPWVAFERLQSVVGATTYDSLIRDAFTPTQAAEIPENYRLIWKLRTSGVITLNVDSLSARAHASINSGKHLSTFVGRNAGSALPYLHDATDFVAQLHGVLDDRQSWIFTKSELKRQLKSEQYRQFVHQALTGCVNVFLGITADDIAVGGFLNELSNSELRPRSAYWYTQRNDQETDRWGERVGLRPIMYRSDVDHASAVTDFLNELLTSHPSPEPVPSPIVPPTIDSQLDQPELPPVSEIVHLDPEDLRAALNATATRILAPRNEDAYREYDQFCVEYDRAIHMAWYASLKDSENTFLGFTLHEEVATGSFGKVFRGTDGTGRIVAVKVLRQDVRSNPLMLQSFRRGVRSMEILAKNSVQDMVEYYAAFELPSAVVMEWIDGPNLALGKESGYLNDWSQILHISKSLADVLRRAHALPERVLHRDLRPANIMLRDLWSDSVNYEVVVLDFDLSWHLGAEQQSVQYSSALGYLAPEQRISGKGTTRSASVDSYGLGMTLFFLLSGTDPVPGQHLHSDYAEEVNRFTSMIYEPTWHCIPARYARLVIRMTADAQKNRPDMSEILQELTLLTDIQSGTTESTVPAEIKAEELAARSNFFDGYRYDHDSISFSAVERRGIRTSLIARPETASIDLSIEWNRTGVEDRNSIGKYAQRAVSGVSQRLSSLGWAVKVVSNSSQGFLITASIRSSKLMLARTADLDSALELIRFE